jgi:hypothetical protein
MYPVVQHTSFKISHVSGGGSGAGEEAAGGFGDGRRDARFDQSRAAPDRAVLIQNSIFLQDQFYHLFVLHFCSKQNDLDVCRSVQV